MWIPPQGFRHAARLLLQGRARRVSHSSGDGARDLEALASELVELARDTRVSPQASVWMSAEFGVIVDALAPACGLDTDAVRALKSDAREKFARIVQTPSSPKDLFLVYVPQDRLPVAAPLAVELEKRRISVAFGEYEVGAAEDFASLVAEGLSSHKRGVLLWTSEAQKVFGRKPDVPDNSRHGFRVLEQGSLGENLTLLADWIASSEPPR